MNKLNKFLTKAGFLMMTGVFVSVVFNHLTASVVEISESDWEGAMVMHEYFIDTSLISENCPSISENGELILNEFFVDTNFGFIR